MVADATAARSRAGGCPRTTPLAVVGEAALRVGMTEKNDLLRALPLADRLRIAAVDLAVTGAPRALVAARWRAADARRKG